MNKEQLLQVLSKIALCMEENKIYLTTLDTEIGDGDHGINMARGFNAVASRLPEMAELSVGEILIQTGKILIKEIAGSSGSLYGSAFKCAGKAADGMEEISLQDFTMLLENGIARICQLGGATRGEKTMLDSMFPALDTLKAGGNLSQAVAAAQQGTEHTKEIIATKGRASYVGERSIGHQDPGATSFTLILQTINDFVMN